MRVAVTGASGHLGANLVRELLKQGREVRAIYNDDSRALDGLDLETVDLDVRDAEAVSKAIQGVDVVYHLAATISWERREYPKLYDINVNGTKHVAQACKKHDVQKLIHFSSIHALVPTPFDIPVDENRPLVNGEKFRPYDRSKAAAQAYIQNEARENGLPAVVVNPTAVLGPNDFKISAMGSVLLDWYYQRMPTLVQGGYDWVDARDVVRVALAAEEKGRIGESYLASGHFTSVKELAQTVGKVMNIKTPSWVCPAWLAMFGAPFSAGWAHIWGKQPRYTMDSIRILNENPCILHEKANQEFGYEPKPLEDTILAAFDWYKEFGFLDNPSLSKAS